MITINYENLRKRKTRFLFYKYYVPQKGEIQISKESKQNLQQEAKWAEEFTAKPNERGSVPKLNVTENFLNLVFQHFPKWAKKPHHFELRKGKKLTKVIEFYRPVTGLTLLKHLIVIAQNCERSS